MERRIRCGTQVLDAAWDTAEQRWAIRTDAGELTADVLVSATGPLPQPHRPDLPGLERFAGPVLHTGNWDPATDLTGLRVAVIGSGASAIQLVPQLAGRAAEVIVLQRTPPWIMPRHDRPIPAARRERYARRPLLQRLARWRIYVTREIGLVGFVRAPGLLHGVSGGGVSVGVGGVERLCRRHLRSQVPDPGLRQLLTPDYRAGCKRILLSDDYYPALLRDDVELVASAAARFEPGAVVTADGSRREIDAVVFATGFSTTDPPIAHHVTGREGRTLAETWADGGMQALRGSSVHGFPNLFFLAGPNTGLGHTSMVAIIESQLAYLADALRLLDDRDLAAIEPTNHAQAAWNRTLQDRLRRETRHVDPVEYRLIPRAHRRTALR